MPTAVPAAIAPVPAGATLASSTGQTTGEVGASVARQPDCIKAKSAMPTAVPAAIAQVPVGYACQ